MTPSKLLFLCLTTAICATSAFGQLRFSTRDLRGNYVFSYQGTLVNTQTALPTPISAIGVMTLDGEGKITRATRHLSVGGVIVRASSTGTYTVTPEGLGTATFIVLPLDGEPAIVPPTQETFLFVLKSRQSGFGVSGTVRLANGENLPLLAITRVEFARQEEP